jgi:hypothetical protein
MTPASSAYSTRLAMCEPLEQLIDALLYEGYALYPYTPGAAKNATPTPFGILYPPAYAAALPSTFERLELRCELHAPPDAVLSAEVRFLAAAGERHEAVAHRVRLADVTVGVLAASSATAEPGQPDQPGASGQPGANSASGQPGANSMSGQPGANRTSGQPCANSTSGQPCAQREVEIAGESPRRLLLALGLSAHELGSGHYEVTLAVENRTPCAQGLDRPAALAHSLLSTHPILRVSGGRFSSPLECPCGSVNTFPVLASATDDAVIGAAIVLPDHPQIAPESRGGMFDSTEIEEALLLHVRTLSDAEREEIERQDPLVREMVARAATATPEDILALHGRVTLRDPVTDTPPEEPPDLVDPQAGEQHAEVAGVRFTRGAKVRIRPGPDADLHARMLDGRTATIERIMIDYDGKTHLGVTIDDDPGQELLRESGRFLFFFAPEVEVLR